MKRTGLFVFVKDAVCLLWTRKTKLSQCHLVNQNSYTKWPGIEHGPPWSEAEPSSYRAVNTPSVIKKLSVNVVYRKSRCCPETHTKHINSTLCGLDEEFYSLLHLAIHTASVSEQQQAIKLVLDWMYRGAEKSLARPTSRCILFDG